MSKRRITYTRNPIYIFYALIATFSFTLVALIVTNPNLGTLERVVFEVFYRLPDFLTPFALILVILAALAPLVATGLFIFKGRLDAVIRLLATILFATLVAWLSSQLISRSVSPQLVAEFSERTSLPLGGFPSVYGAVSLAAGLVLASYAPSSYRRLFLWLSITAGCSLLYLGIVLPLNVIAGWLIGILGYSIGALALGSRFKPISADKLAQKLSKQGLKEAALKPASVDARGSVPFFGSYEGGKIFVKVFNQDNNAADWLFKLIRRLQYRRLEDEVPSLTPKRAIEHEAYLTMLATHEAKVRVPKLIGVFKVGANSYAMVLKRLDAEGLDKISKNKISDKLLANIWSQIKRLHENRIIHKDLRTANIMVEKTTGLPWLIDFGFSESAINEKSSYKDNVEFIASSATKIGAKRAVAAALKALGSKQLGEALPYMQYAALSGATTTALKQRQGLLDELRQEMHQAAGLDESEDKKARISRLKIAR